MSGDTISPDELWRHLRQWLTDHPDAAKKEFAIALRGNGFVQCMAQAVAYANGGYEFVRKAPDIFITFGRRLRSGSDKQETDLTAEWLDRPTRRELRARLVGGLRQNGEPFLLASGDGCDEARKEYAMLFPATINS